MDPLTIAALLGLAGKALETGVSAWKAWLDRGRGGVAFASDGSQHPLPQDGRDLSPSLSGGRYWEREQLVPFQVAFVAADEWARDYLDAEQPALLVIEDQDQESPLDSIVAIGTLGDGFEGTLPAGDYILGVCVFLDPDASTWNDIDGGGFVEFSVGTRQPPFLLEVPVEVISESAMILEAPETLAFHSGRLAAGQQNVYTMTMESGITHQIYVDPSDPSADFDLDVYDENGNLVDTDQDPASHAQCEVTPRWTGSFDLVVSCHRGYSEYEILVQV